MRRASGLPTVLLLAAASASLAGGTRVGLRVQRGRQDQRGVVDGQLSPNAGLASPQESHWLEWLSIAAPESLAGPPFLRHLHLDSWLADRLGPKASLLAATLLLSGQRQSRDVSAEQPHIVVNQPTPQVTRGQLAFQFFLDWIEAFIIIIGLISVATGLAYWYHKKSTKSRDDFVTVRSATTGAAGPPAGVEESFQEWQHGVFSCASEPRTCLWGFLCPSIRWADTIGVVGFLGFWSAFSIYVLLQAVGVVTGEVLLWITLALLCTGYRQQLRLKFGMRMDRVTFAQDCALYCCCPCCVIVQEAKHVDEALRVGHPVFIRTAPESAPTPSPAAAEAAPPSLPPSSADDNAAVAQDGAGTSA